MREFIFPIIYFIASTLFGILGFAKDSEISQLLFVVSANLLVYSVLAYKTEGSLPIGSAAHSP